MIYALIILAIGILAVAGWMWRPKAQPVPLAVPEAKEPDEPIRPPAPVWHDSFNFAHFNQTRRKYADDIDDEARRLVSKLESVRQSIGEDMAALKRLRAESDAAKAEAADIRKLKAEAEAKLEAQRGELRKVMEAREADADRIATLNELLGVRDGELARSREELAKLDFEHKATVESLARSDEALGRNGLQLHEAQVNLARLEQLLQERDEELVLQAEQIESLRAETAARRKQIETLELQLALLTERFDEARLESQFLVGKLTESQEKSNDRADRLQADGEAMRRHIVETERARDRLLGQVGQLRAENAGLRAESQVKLRDLETLNNELTANIAVLERMLSNARAVRAQPAPARAHLRLIAQAKKVPGRAQGG
jgi:chromosome segregation ATPase